MDKLLEREFIHTKVFDRSWKEIGCDDDDLIELQKAICENPRGYPVIPGTGGVRKMRIALDGKGKSGGARVLYIDFYLRETVGLLYAYSKHDQENIDDSERKALKLMIETIESNWRKKS